MAKANGHITPFISTDDFEKIFREYFTPLVYFAVKYVKDTDTAKEIVHHVFYRIWENKTEIHLDKPLRSYLFTAVHNRCLNYVRDHARFHPEEVSDNLLAVMVESTAQDNLEAIELEAAFSSALSELPDKCALIFQMNRINGLKYREIAVKLNISVKTVEAQMTKALKLLREKLVDYLDVILLWLIINFF